MAAHGSMTTRLGIDGKFSAEQQSYFQKEDIAAGRAIITLMTAVFSVGLFGAAMVCIAVW